MQRLNIVITNLYSFLYVCLIIVPATVLSFITIFERHKELNLIIEKNDVYYVFLILKFS